MYCQFNMTKEFFFFLYSIQVENLEETKYDPTPITWSLQLQLALHDPSTIIALASHTTRSPLLSAPANRLVGRAPHMQPA